MTAIELANLFHEAYERLAPEYGYETRTETREFNQYSINGRLMVAVCEEILRSLPELPTPVEAETCECRRDHGRKMNIVTGEQWCIGCGKPITVKPGEPK